MRASSALNLFSPLLLALATAAIAGLAAVTPVEAAPLLAVPAAFAAASLTA